MKEFFMKIAFLVTGILIGYGATVSNCKAEVNHEPVQHHGS